MSSLVRGRAWSRLAAVAPLRLQGRGGRLPRAYYQAAAVVPLVLLIGWGTWLAASTGLFAPARARIGEPAPAFALADLDGRPIRLADLRGRPVVVNFWASWCGPCVEEFPLLGRALDRHHDQGLAVVGIVFNDHSESARAFMTRMGARWPAAMDPGGELAAGYGIFAPPATVFIGPDGIVRGRQIGPFSAADLERQLALILERSP